MNNLKKVFSRREMLGTVVALGGLVIAHPIRSVLAQEVKPSSRRSKSWGLSTPSSGRSTMTWI